MTDDMYSLMEWLEGESLKAHHEITRKLEITNRTPFAQLPAYELGISIGIKKALDLTIAHIKNGSKKELHRTLTEKR